METIINRNIQMRSYARLAMELIKGALPDVDFHLMCASDNMPRQWREYSAFRVHECPDAVPPIGVVLDTKIRSPWEVPDLELYARRITDALIESVQLRAKALEVASAGRPTPLVILVGALLAINVAGRFTDLSGIAQPIQQSVEVGVIGTWRVGSSQKKKTVRGFCPILIEKKERTAGEKSSYVNSKSFV